MSEQEQTIEWYLARDGKQVGPVSDLELRKIVELGHLRPTDLVWRQGMPEWAPAARTFPQLAAPAPPPPPPKPPVQQHAPPPQPPTAAPRDAEGQRTGEAPAARGQAPRPSQTGHGPAAEVTGPDRPAAPTRPDGDRFNRPGPQAPARPVGQEPGHPATTGPRQPGPGAGPGPAMAPNRAPPGPGAMGAQQRPGAGPHAPQRPREGAPGPAGPHQPGSIGPAQHQPPSGAAIPQSHDDEPHLHEAPRRRFPVKAAVAIVLLCVVGAAGILIIRSGRLEPLTKMIGIAKTKSDEVPVVRAPTQASKTAPAKEMASAAQPAPAPTATGPGTTGQGTTPADVDAALQRTQLWQIVKREFPEWYGERVAETAKMRVEGKSEKEIAESLTKILVELRRKNASAALSAGPARLKFVAAKFVENLANLSKHSVDACYGFISQGETNPMIMDLLRASPQTASLQAQMAAIFEAVAEGRKKPQSHDSPKQGDYDILAQQLAAKGWSTADLQTFIDARALARAKPERVCQMVQDWFSAQLAVKDEATQIRLLVETLKPVVAG